VLEKRDAKVKRSAPSVNGMVPRVKQNSPGPFFRSDASSACDGYKTLMVPAASAGI